MHFAGLRSVGVLGPQTPAVPDKAAATQVSSGRGRPYSDTYGREGARQGPEASSGRKGKGALGVATKAPSAAPPAGKHSFPGALADLHLCLGIPSSGLVPGSDPGARPGHSGKCSPLGVKAGLPIRSNEGRPASKGLTLTLIPGWTFRIPGKWLNLDMCCPEGRQLANAEIPASDPNRSRFSEQAVRCSYFGGETQAKVPPIPAPAPTPDLPCATRRHQEREAPTGTGM